MLLAMTAGMTSFNNLFCNKGAYRASKTGKLRKGEKK